MWDPHNMKALIALEAYVAEARAALLGPHADTSYLFPANNGAGEPLGANAVSLMLTRRYKAPTVKQHLAAIRMLFDWLVTAQVVPMNPAASVRGPRHQGNRSLSGSTPARDRSASAGATDAFTRRMKSGPMKA